MKTLQKAVAFCAFVFFTIQIVSAQETKVELNWISFEEAVAKNQTAPRKIFVDIYTDWCGWCKRMDATTFSDPTIVKYMNEKYYCVKFNAEKNGPLKFNGYDFRIPENAKTHELAIALMQNKLTGYPCASFLNEKNEIISTRSGYANAENFLPIVEFFGDNAYLKGSWDDFYASYQARNKK